VGRFFGAGDGDFACSDQFLNAIRPHAADEGIDLVFIPGQFNGQVAPAHVDNPAPENIDGLQDFQPGFGPDFDPDQSQFPINNGFLAEVGYLMHNNRLMQLFGNLLNDLAVTFTTSSSGKGWVFRLDTREAVNIIGPPGKQP
jgi:hypothetical protein